MALNPVVLALTRSGEAVAHRAAEALGAPVHGREGRVEHADVTFPNALDHIRTLFAAGRPVVGVCASGILIRAVAPLLSDKRKDSPVIAVSDDGAVVVPLLGGHQGANRLACRIADSLDAKAAVTTAGDVSLGLALDEPPSGWMLDNPEAAKSAMAALLGGAALRLSGDEAAHASWVADLPAAEGREDAVELICTARRRAERPPDALIYRPQRFILGVGSSRHCPPEEMLNLAKRVLDEANLANGALAAIATVDLKADEPAILELSRQLGAPLRLFTPDELEAETERTATPSKAVFAEIGSHGVAENAALAAAGPKAALHLPKRKTAMATAALAVAPAPIAAPAGRKRGRLALVGIGPGQAEWRTPEASRLIAEADELVGYSLYLDLIGPLAAGKPRRDFPLGDEEKRCRYALERAGEGRNVALICSGDAGIYAMGALVYELLDQSAAEGGVSDSARRIEVISAPGISAMQAAAARAGAPLGHDFCAISLSDLLTPREDILRRVRAAAEADFVIAFYNPVSRQRRDLLPLARDILLKHRPADCPVLLAGSLGRAEESLGYRRLDSLDECGIDMLTLVLVGSSQSRLAELGEGPRMYTPRGYARKTESGCPPSRSAVP